jgi:release factor glutamine methyltransferase
LSRRALAATTVRDALDSAVIALTAAGCDTPRLDAEVLLAAVLGVDRAALISGPGRELSGAEARQFADFARRRREREPVAYILGAQGFRSIELLVDRRVLIPRPETEHVVEAALGLPSSARVVDVGTGSGAIALALKDERPDLRVVGTDTSADALDVARANADRLGLDVEFVHGDLLAGVAADAIVSNPPYVAEGDPVMPDVVRYEPHAALFAEDGLAVIRRLVAAAGAARFIALEHGEGQGEAVAALVRDAGFDVEHVRDLAGIDRVVVGRRDG